jgi:hypothetical protein
MSLATNILQNSIPQILNIRENTTTVNHTHKTRSRSHIPHVDIELKLGSIITINIHPHKRVIRVNSLKLHTTANPTTRTKTSTKNSQKHYSKPSNQNQPIQKQDNTTKTQRLLGQLL